MTDALDENELSALLKAGVWSLVDGTLLAEFRFEKSALAAAFVNEIVDFAQKSDHHPNMRWEYCTVTLSLFTHDLGGLSSRDLEFARGIDRMRSGR